jgi:hypothetical protein
LMGRSLEPAPLKPASSLPAAFNATSEFSKFAR